MRVLATVLISAVLFYSCSDDNERGTTQFRVSLTDSPGDYQQVNVDIQSVEIHRSGDDT